jgi:hypothetical protein
MRLVMFMFCMFSTVAYGQSILGKWQLVDESNCMEDKLPAADDNGASLASEMKQIGSPAPQIVEFKEKGAGEESMRILNRKKAANAKNFLYKFSGESLLILDKRSQTITESYAVDKLSADSLVISSSSKPCDIKIFVKIKQARN